jgi:hypothetical protein
VTFVLSLLLLWAKHDKPQRIGSLVVLICCILAVTLTTIAFLVDIIVASVLRSKVRDATDGLVFVNYGNAVSKMFPPSLLAAQFYLPDLVDFACHNRAVVRHRWCMLWYFPATQATV